jgi:lysophospholipid acyltransferase (LPLAT)-like uncharacterized protein
MGAIAAWLGVQPVIGASRVGRRGAAQTLAAWRVLVETLEGGGNVVIAADGPLGPGRRARPGAVRLARTGGVPLLPCAMSARRGFELSTWDHLFVPLPFSTIYLVVGEPLVANSLTPLTLALEEAQRAVDVAAGRTHDAIKA